MIVKCHYTLHVLGSKDEAIVFLCHTTMLAVEFGPRSEKHACTFYCTTLHNLYDLKRLLPS